MNILKAANFKVEFPKEYLAIKKSKILKNVKTLSSSDIVSIIDVIGAFESFAIFGLLDLKLDDFNAKDFVSIVNLLCDPGSKIPKSARKPFLSSIIDQWIPVGGLKGEPLVWLSNQIPDDVLRVLKDNNVHPDALSTFVCDGKMPKSLSGANGPLGLFCIWPGIKSSTADNSPPLLSEPVTSPDQGNEEDSVIVLDDTDEEDNGATLKSDLKSLDLNQSTTNDASSLRTESVVSETDPDPEQFEDDARKSEPDLRIPLIDANAIHIVSYYNQEMETNDCHPRAGENGNQPEVPWYQADLENFQEKYPFINKSWCHSLFKLARHPNYSRIGKRMEPPLVFAIRTLGYRIKKGSVPFCAFVDITEFLLKFNFNVNHCDAFGKIAYDYAIDIIAGRMKNFSQLYSLPDDAKKLLDLLKPHY